MEVYIKLIKEKNSMLIKKLNVNKSNAFGVKKNLSQFGEIESLSVHYERDSKKPTLFAGS